MLETMKKWKELEYEARKEIVKNIGKNDESVGKIKMGLILSDETTKKIKDSLISADGTKKPSFFEAFIHLYPYSISFFLGILVSIFFHFNHAKH